MVVLETGGEGEQQRIWHPTPFRTKIVKMHTLVTTTALDIITLFKTKENAHRLVFKSLVGDYGPTGTEF